MLQNNETLHRYSHTFSKFLIALIRSVITQPIDYKFPMKKEQIKIAQILLSNIEGNLDLQAIIHQFGLSLFSTPPIVKDSNKWSCPLQCYLAVDNLRDDGSFNDAHHLTSSLAHWEYIIRGICLYEANETADTYANGIIGYCYHSFSISNLSLNMF